LPPFPHTACGQAGYLPHTAASVPVCLLLHQ
jgi:hypothetical protein